MANYNYRLSYHFHNDHLIMVQKESGEFKEMVDINQLPKKTQVYCYNGIWASAADIRDDFYLFELISRYALHKFSQENNTEENESY